MQMLDYKLEQLKSKGNFFLVLLQYLRTPINIITFWRFYHNANVEMRKINH